MSEYKDLTKFSKKFDEMEVDDTGVFKTGPLNFDEVISIVRSIIKYNHKYESLGVTLIVTKGMLVTLDTELKWKDFLLYFTRCYKPYFDKGVGIMIISDALRVVLNINQQADVKSGIEFSVKKWYSRLSE